MPPQQLPYNFYAPHLWLNRFHSLDDALDSNFKLLHTVWASFGQLSQSQFDALMDEAGAEAQTFASLRPALPATVVASPEASLDSAFEVTQLLNLYAFSLGLNSFALGSLPTAVESTFTANQLPPIQTIRRVFRHIAHDIELIQRATVQRRREQDTAGNTLMSASAKAVLVMDKLAILALAPAQALLPSDSPIVPITYFSEYTHIHRTPYKEDVLLIGVRYDIVPLELNRVFGSAAEVYAAHDPFPAFELMAIPHEVGHYVYHHGRVERGEGPTFAAIAQHEFANHPHFHWCEEIFADIYACLIAGALAPLGLQALLASTDSHEICANDGAHPTAVVRPFLLSRILQILPYGLEQAAQALAANWTAMLRLDGFHIEGAFGDDDFVAILPDMDEPIYLGGILAEITPLLEAFCGLLLNYLNLDNVEGIPWSRHDHDNLHEYEAEMAHLTTAVFAQSPIPTKLISIDYHPAQDLAQLLPGWGDSGPTGSGGSTYKVGEDKDKSKDDGKNKTEPPKIQG